VLGGETEWNYREEGKRRRSGAIKPAGVKKKEIKKRKSTKKEGRGGKVVNMRKNFPYSKIRWGRNAPVGDREASQEAKPTNALAQKSAT